MKITQLLKLYIYKNKINYKGKGRQKLLSAKNAKMFIHLQNGGSTVVPLTTIWLLIQVVVCWLAFTMNISTA